MSPPRPAHASPSSTKVASRDGTAFFYGTLMAPEVFYSVVYGHKAPGRDKEKETSMRPAILYGYRRQRVKGHDFPAITQRQGPQRDQAKVRGIYITGLTPQHIDQLDFFEGSMYRKEDVTVKLLNNIGIFDPVVDSDLPKVEGHQVPTRTYVWQYPQAQLEDSEWDFEHFKSVKLQRWTRGTSPERREVPDHGSSAAEAVHAGRSGLSSDAASRSTTGEKQDRAGSREGQISGGGTAKSTRTKRSSPQRGATPPAGRDPTAQ